MRREVISDKQGISLLVLFVWGSSLILGIAGPGKRDAWLAAILGMLLAIVMSLFYSSILVSFPEKDIFDINEIVFGKFIGKLINLIYMWFAFHLGALVLDNFTEFISIVGLPDTPKVVPIIFFIILCIWGVKEGIEVLARWAEIFILILLITIVLTVTLSAYQIDIDNIRPVLGDGITPLIKGTFSAFAFPFSETVVFTMIFSCLKSKTSCNKVYIRGLLFAGIIFAILAARNILASGPRVIELNYFPAYMVISRINFGEFIQRIETVTTVSFLIAGFVKVSICLMGACKGAAKILGFQDYRFLVTPIGLGMMSISFKVYESMLQTSNWAVNVYPYYAFIFEVILPIITFIGVKRSCRKRGVVNI